jgi:ATP-dependent helicase/nuclease subunit A
MNGVPSSGHLRPNGLPVSSAPTDELLHSDDQNRRRALELDSFIVEAPAGAGKTELLTQRYLRLLETVEAPEEIIAITFTNKAAGEMRSRIQESLLLAASGVAPDKPHKLVTFGLASAALERSKELGWDLLAQTGRMRLTTIDALCTSLARQMPLLSRFGAQPATIEDARRHYLDAAIRALEHLEGDGEHAEAVATALEYLDNDTAQLAKLLAQMLGRREQWKELAALEDPELAVDDALRAMVDGELQRIADSLDAHWQARLMPLARYASANLADEIFDHWTAPLETNSEALSDWRAVADLVLTQKDDPRKTVTVKNGFPAGKEGKAQKDAMLELLAELSAKQALALQRIRRLPQITHDNDKIVRALTQLMKLAAAELWLVFRERGEVDFVELSSRAIAALGDELDPTELGLRLDYGIKHLLVDEFQDTSPTQIDLLSRLTAGWEPGDGRTLFVVGDPMQSIYRFRKADVGLFIRVRDNGIGNIPLTSLRLSRNNRSCAEVVEWINQSFPQVFPETDDPIRGEIAYREFVATRDSDRDAGVTVHPVLVAKTDGTAIGNQREAEAIVQTIAAEWSVDPKRKIAILVSARSHLLELVSAIRQRHPEWRYSAVEVEALLERQPVQDLISLTCALHHRADRLHWLAILRAPWCGLVLADLHALAGDDHESTLWSLMNDASRVARLSADGVQRLTSLHCVLQEAFAGQGRQTRRRWIEDVWRKLGGPSCLSGANDLSDVEAFLARLDQLDATGRFSIDTLESDMEKLFAAPDSQADGRLELMTIHKSKGLEFDTVILPGLHRRLRPNDPPLLVWDSFPMEQGEQLLVAPVNRRAASSNEGPSAYDYLRQMEADRKHNEAARVLYVAATRTVRHLHIFGVCKVDEQGRLIDPVKTTGLGHLWPALKAEFDGTGSETSLVTSDTIALANESSFDEEEDVRDDLADFVPDLVRLRATHIRPSEWEAPALASSTNDSFSEDEMLAATIGTLAHACMQQIATDSSAWTIGRIEGMGPSLERWLINRSCNPKDAVIAAQRVIHLLTVTLSSEDGQWVLGRHEDDAAELAMSTLSPWDADGETTGSPQTRVVDRSFVENDERWVIDYKTAELGKGACSQELREHAERYRAQLDQYASLFQQESRRMRKAVFYLAHGALIELQ